MNGIKRTKIDNELRVIRKQYIQSRITVLPDQYLIDFDRSDIDHYPLSKPIVKYDR